MANYFVSYDLNGQHPTHKEMDEHLKKLGPCVHRALETVWFVKYAGDASKLFDYANSILSNNDRLIVIQASWVVWRNLLVADDKLKQCWE